MNKTTKPQNLLPLWLTAALCACVLAGGTCLLLGAGILGLLCFLAGAGIYGTLFFVGRPALWLADTAAVVLILLAVGWNQPSLLLFAPAVLLPGVAIFFAVRRKSGKTSTVLLAALSLLLLLCALLLVTRAADGRSLAPSQIAADWNETLTEVKTAIRTELAASFEAMSEQTKSEYEAKSGQSFDAFVSSVLTLADSAVDTIKLLLIGFLLATAEILAFVAVESFVLTVKLSHIEALFPEPRWRLLPTKVTAIVFLVSVGLSVLTSFFSGTFMSGLYVISLNLLLILLPCMVACGASVLPMRFRRNASGRRNLFPLWVTLLAVLFLSWLAIPLLVFVLAMTSVRAVFAAYAAAEPTDQDRQ